jgi:EmrB/QacA subfamily drug resistance transporter
VSKTKDFDGAVDDDTALASPGEPDISPDGGATSPDAVLAAAHHEAPMTHRQILVVFSGLMLGLFLAALDQSVVGTALPTIVGDFHGQNKISWVVTAYLLTSTASAPLYGKLSDLYGRKKLFQLCIVIFLIASALAGLSQNMAELIAFRGLQGLGAGGLIVLAMTIIGDIIPPAQRGKYQGYFGAVFGVASVAGPLVGGFLVESINWRWIFYINLPIGIVALFVTSAVLKDRSVRTSHKIDYAGASFLLLGVSSLLMMTTFGGSPEGWPWASWQIICLGVLGAFFVVTFIRWEMKVASEPIVPMYLFRKRVFTTANAAGFVVGVAMFGAIIYLPVYLQDVKEVSPTVSGLMLIPLMVGMLFTSITSGQIIARIGRYKIFPVVGTALMTVGIYLFSLMSVNTSDLLLSVYMFVVGAGLGLVMQVLILAVQNGVDYKDLGAATSLSNFFRSMGGAFGTAILGAILTDRLTGNLLRALPAGARSQIGVIGQAVVGSPAQLKVLQKVHPTWHAAAVQAYVHSINEVFLVAVPIVALSFVAVLLMPEIRLRKTVRTGGGTPGDGSDGSEQVPSAAAALAG